MHHMHLYRRNAPEICFACGERLEDSIFGKQFRRRIRCSVVVSVWCVVGGFGKQFLDVVTLFFGCGVWPEVKTNPFNSVEEEVAFLRV